MALVGAVVIIWCALEVWQFPRQESRSYFPLDLFDSVKNGLPRIEIKFYADRLSSFFLLLTGIFTLAVVFHLMGWIENVTTNDQLITAAFNLFVLSIVFTILADTAYCFLFFQEGMTLSFAYLAVFRHNFYLQQPQVSSKEFEASKLAFKSYLIFEHIGITLIAISFILLSIYPSMLTSDFKGSSFDFGFFRSSLHNSNAPVPVISSLIFLSALAGFGIKAGIFPTHVWVPLVHPYSPTSIHAMMSGIALKVAGLYGMYRLFFFFLPRIQWWWGWVVLITAGATALFGVFFAILTRNLKVALASHSVENIGIILAGIGLGLIFSAKEKMFLAVLAIIASLYHLLNHSVFKGLLFFCTGAIEDRLGVVEMDRLGGLMNRYPLTSITFLIGSLSIAGLPPFNGFVSEWLLLQTIFSSVDLYFLIKEQVFVLIGLLVALICLLLAFSLTALAFVKIAGETLLGAPRDLRVAQNAHLGEVRLPMRVVLLSFAIMCILLGVFPASVTHQLSYLSAEIIPSYQANAETLVDGGNIILNIPLGKSQPSSNEPEKIIPEKLEHDQTHYQTRLSRRMVIALALVVIVSAVIGVSLCCIKTLKRRFFIVASPWTCGAPFNSSLMQYTGTSFANLIWGTFEQREVEVAEDETLGDFSKWQKSIVLPYKETLMPGSVVTDVIRQKINSAIVQFLSFCENFGIRTQPGDIRVYITYIFALFILILVGLLGFPDWNTGW